MNCNNICIFCNIQLKPGGNFEGVVSLFNRLTVNSVLVLRYQQLEEVD
jgi:hypothetical protein